MSGRYLIVPLKRSFSGVEPTYRIWTLAYLGLMLVTWSNKKTNQSPDEPKHNHIIYLLKSRIQFHVIPYRWQWLLHLVIVAFLFLWPQRSPVTRKIRKKLQKLAHALTLATPVQFQTTKTSHKKRSIIHHSYETISGQSTCCSTLWQLCMRAGFCSFPSHTSHLLSFVFPQHVAC